MRSIAVWLGLSALIVVLDQITKQVVLQIRVARYHPDIAQYLVKHLRGTASAAFFAQRIDDVPRFISENTQDNLAI